MHHMNTVRSFLTALRRPFDARAVHQRDNAAIVGGMHDLPYSTRTTLTSIDPPTSGYLIRVLAPTSSSDGFG
jgi:hypothetical protein